MSSGQRIPLDEATVIAHEFIGLIDPYCERVLIAGSIRRQSPTVGDIEVIAVPRVETVSTVDMFDTVIGTEEVDYLDGFLNTGLALGTVQKRVSEKGATAWGRKLKRLVFQGAAVDLFCTTINQWGVIATIRTGPADYSHALVSPKGMPVPGINRVGCLPERFRVQDGWLTSRVSGQRIPTPTEEGFFELIDVPWLAPEERR